MRFNLILEAPNLPAIITLNYQYPLSAAIYKIIERGDGAYADFLHAQGYQHGAKTFKFFTFSDLRTPFTIYQDRLLMKTNKAELTVCFHVPNAAENFIKGLFMHQRLDIVDSKSKVTFNVERVEAQDTTITQGAIATILLQPISPVVVGFKNEKGHYDYLPPTASDYTKLLVSNLLEKYAAAYNATTDELTLLQSQVTITPLFLSKQPRPRLIAIKQGTAAETKVKGYDKFRLHITAPKEFLQLALNAGIGIHNAMGMGCVEIVE